jgi:hypothetical protein
LLRPGRCVLDRADVLPFSASHYKTGLSPGQSRPAHSRRLHRLGCGSRMRGVDSVGR